MSELLQYTNSACLFKVTLTYLCTFHNNQLLYLYYIDSCVLKGDSDFCILSYQSHIRVLYFFQYYCILVCIRILEFLSSSDTSSPLDTSRLYSCLGKYIFVKVSLNNILYTKIIICQWVQRYLVHKHSSLHVMFIFTIDSGSFFLLLNQVRTNKLI